jgi:di/tripeptidase
MKKFITKVINERAKIITINGDEMLNSKTDYPEIIKYQKVMQKAFNETITFEKEHGGSDARIFADLNIPVWLQNPKGGGPHSSGEWVDVTSIELMAQGLKEYLTKS